LDIALSIREATLNDLPKIKQIIGLSFPRFFRFFASHSVDAELGKVLVATAQGTVMGFVKLIEFQVGSVKYGCILWIATHPTFRRKGIAHALTNAGVNSLKKEGSKAVFASTQRRNSAAKGALGTAGFRRMGFLDLWLLFGWRVFSFYSEIWYAPGEVVFMHS